MKQKDKHDVDRRQALKVFGLAAAPLVTGTFGLPGYHPAVPAQETDGIWQPRVLDLEQTALASEILDRIIPPTDTPGAKAALVHQYFDWRLSRSPEEARQLATSQLSLIEERARRRFGRSFTQLTDPERDASLRSLFELPRSQAGRQAVESLKSIAIEGYYRSEIGMHDELGYDGNKYLSKFEGCTHPEHLAWTPSDGSEGER